MFWNCENVNKECKNIKKELVKVLEEEKNNLYNNKNLVFEALQEKLEALGYDVIYNEKAGHIRTHAYIENGHCYGGLKVASLYIEKEVHSEKLYYFSYILRNENKQN